MKRLILRLCAALFILFSISLNVFAQPTEDIQSRISSIQTEISIRKGSLNSISTLENESLLVCDNVSRQISDVQSQIVTLTLEITELDKQISEKEDLYGEYCALYAENLNLLNERILAAENITSDTDMGPSYEFTFKENLIASIATENSNATEPILEYMESTETELNSLLTKKEEKVFENESLEKLLDMLWDDFFYHEELILSYSNQKTKLESEITELNLESDNLIFQLEEERKQAVILQQEQAVMTSANLSSEIELRYSVLDPLWPVPNWGTEYISDVFGDGHYGLDIAANFGEPVVAAVSGTVTSAGSHYSWGENILIYHDENYSTRYAHLSSLAVGEGEYVEKGQVIGYIGSTGNSTGNHLHFEVYFNEMRVDPLPYL